MPFEFSDFSVHIRLGLGFASFNVRAGSFRLLLAGLGNVMSAANFPFRTQRVYVSGFGVSLYFASGLLQVVACWAGFVGRHFSLRNAALVSALG